MPSSPQANPPSGQRPRSDSKNSHTAAVSHGARSPRRANAATSAPVTA